MTEIYCGNNSLHSDLTNGNLVLGTRYKCLQKGIGKGMNMPYDLSYNEPYLPIDTRKIYCGNYNLLPENYYSFGNLPQCLQKGVGIGKRIKNQNQNEYSPIQFTNSFFNLKKVTIFVIYAILLFFILYKIKPTIITNKNDKINKNHIIWFRFFLVYFMFLLVFIIILKLF